MAERRTGREEIVDLLRDVKALLGIEAERLLRGSDFLGSERRAVAAMRTLLRRRALADRGRRDDEDGDVRDLLRLAERLLDRVVVVSVDLQHLPTVRLEALLRVIAVRIRDMSLDLDVVEVVDDLESAELQRAREGRCLVADALLHVAVAAKDPGEVRALLHLRADRHADAHRKTLSKRARRHLDARHHPALGMSRAAASELAERLQFLHLEVARPGKMRERVNERRGMSAREDETVAVRPRRVLRIDLEMTKPQGRDEVRHTHRRTGMPGIRLFDDVRAQAADGVRNKLQLIVRDLHFLYLQIRIFLPDFALRRSASRSAIESRASFAVRIRFCLRLSTIPRKYSISAS